MTDVQPVKSTVSQNTVEYFYPALLSSYNAGGPDALFGNARLDFQFAIDATGIKLIVPQTPLQTGKTKISFLFKASALVQNTLFANDLYSIPLDIQCFGNVDLPTNATSIFIDGQPITAPFQKMQKSIIVNGLASSVQCLQISAYAASHLGDLQTTSVFSPDVAGHFLARGVLIPKITLYGTN